MSMYTEQKFTNAVDKVRLKGVLVQQAKAEAETRKNIAPWLDALDDLMKAKTELDDVILAGLDMTHPAIPIAEVEVVKPDASIDTTPEQTVVASTDGVEVMSNGERGGAEQSKNQDATPDPTPAATVEASPTSTDAASSVASETPAADSVESER